MPAPWQQLLDWWFGQGATAADIAAEKHALWFGYKPAQDAEAGERFGAWTQQALDGGLQEWAGQPEGWLALLLLLDQLPRMIHRGTPQAFAGDARAQQLVRAGLAHGGDMLLAPIQRVFVYLVLEHTENLAVQELAVAHFTALRDIAVADERKLYDDFLDYAERHREVISRFGRFPHRNAMLGRESSDAEAAFLARPGSGF
ncbi:DUF924 domain-containing protein [Stutzerimonas stutzeri]|uniref:DUF924 domain-containing protein n=1 Tax=Stutzerimonas stutzeri TaxID=316 RepID=A0A2N8T924_STUST|nr:DUF924 family protein [Stutzerimonas stutzeri]MCQ4325150.1 DUF924 domain-containing protein [Stutzerimonas stutzeri]PNG11260.1 DUF924 domain-containing protein [Stutzerimonas stutzeri]